MLYRNMSKDCLKASVCLQLITISMVQRSFKGLHHEPLKLDSRCLPSKAELLENILKNIPSNVENVSLTGTEQDSSKEKSNFVER